MDPSQFYNALPLHIDLTDPSFNFENIVISRLNSTFTNGVLLPVTLALTIMHDQRYYTQTSEQIPYKLKLGDYSYTISGFIDSTEYHAKAFVLKRYYKQMRWFECNDSIINICKYEPNKFSTTVIFIMYKLSQIEGLSIQTKEDQIFNQQIQMENDQQNEVSYRIVHDDRRQRIAEPRFFFENQEFKVSDAISIVQPTLSMDIRGMMESMNLNNEGFNHSLRKNSKKPKRSSSCIAKIFGYFFCKSRYSLE